MANLFTSVPIKKPTKSSFPLDHTNFHTNDFGRGQVTFFEEVLPGDLFRGSSETLVRVSPLLSPTLGRVDIVKHLFFVPTRIVDHGWEKFITGYYQRQTDTSATQFKSLPNLMLDLNYSNTYYDLSTPTSGDAATQEFKKLFCVDYNRNLNVLDMLGYLGVDATFPCKPVLFAPILAYWKIYFDYYVDQNIGIEIPLAATQANPTVNGTQRVYNWDDFLDAPVGLFYLSSGSRPATLRELISPVSVISTSVSNQFKPTRRVLVLPSGVSGSTGDYGIPHAFASFLFTAFHKCYSKDYFTSALPWAQKGDPVTMPIDATFGLAASGIGTTSFTDTFTVSGSHADGANVTLNASNQLQVPTTGSSTTPNTALSHNHTFPLAQLASSLKIVTTSDAGFTINDLRSSIRMQEWLERNALGGSRYIEQLLSHFAVKSSDARLQRSQYICGFRAPIKVDATLQSSASETGSTPQGNMAGYALGYNKGKGFRFFAEEHGFLFQLEFIVPKPVMYQGLKRCLTRKFFYDYAWPEFAHLGEQQIDASEIYSTDASEEAWGYQSRYAEYKNHPNEIHGDFLHSSLRSWIFGIREFKEKPNLNDKFLTIDPTVDTSLYSPWPVVTPVAGGTSKTFDKFICETYNNITANRPLPKYGTPLL